MLTHYLIESSAVATANAPALIYKDQTVTYSDLWERVLRVAGGLTSLGIGRYDRIAVYLDKSIETVVSLFAATTAGGVFVPINPLLRANQVGYILRDCNVRVLVTTRPRLEMLAEELRGLKDLRTIVLVDEQAGGHNLIDQDILPWSELNGCGIADPRSDTIDSDMAAILYTSGSTGMPKGVVLSHRNIVAGAKSVSSYLRNHQEDRILAVLPLSFDAGMSQLTTGFNVGAAVVLLNYLLPIDIVRACEKYQITGMTAVPPLWIKLVQENWSHAATESLRYFANTGGHMPRPTLNSLRSIFPKANPFLMYGLTEAFRSTYLDPSQVERRPNSIGKAIPNAEILVVREDGEECAPGEVGELVHRGALVSMGYWNDPELTSRRFRPAPQRPAGIPIPEIAVWSGDLVRKDEDGFLYFVGRNDDMIKTSGYRVSPSEVEEAVIRTGFATEAAAFGVPHPELGQSIFVFAIPPAGEKLDCEGLIGECRRTLPLYMVPLRIEACSQLPRNPNGKVDRKQLRQELAQKGPSLG